MYATVADLRDEGVTEAQATDARLLTLIEEASRLIDRLTGWFFEPRDATYRFDGRGTPSIEPPAPPIHLDALTAAGAAIPMDSEFNPLDRKKYRVNIKTMKMKKPTRYHFR